MHGAAKNEIAFIPLFATASSIPLILSFKNLQNKKKTKKKARLINSVGFFNFSLRIPLHFACSYPMAH